MTPEFIVFVGPMMSGKTTSMLAKLERYKYQGRHVFAFKPKIDSRYSTNEIVSHMGWKLPATTISSGAELIKELTYQFSDSEIPDNSVVAIDELFMIPGIADELVWLYKNNVTVVASTLDLSHSCKPFDEVTKILPFATTIKKCTAVCSVCKADAQYTWRKPVDDENEIVVGGVEIYSPRCKNHHPSMVHNKA